MCVLFCLQFSLGCVHSDGSREWHHHDDFTQLTMSQIVLVTHKHTDKHRIVAADDDVGDDDANAAGNDQIKRTSSSKRDKAG